MVVLIIIAVIGIIGFFIYLNNPNTKYEKGKKLLEQNRIDEAQAIFNEIITKHKLALSKYAECYYLQGNVFEKKNDIKNAISFYNSVTKLEALITSITDKKAFFDVVSKSYFKIADIQLNEIPKKVDIDTINLIKKNIAYIEKTGFKNTSDFKKLLDKHYKLISDIYYKIAFDKFNKINNENTINNINLLQNNLDFIKETALDNQSRFNELINKHNQKIANIYYELAIKNEKENKINDAKKYYLDSLSYLKNVSKNQIYYNVITRLEISKLKLNENIDTKRFADINKSSLQFQNDFYYRYAIHLIRNESFTEAEKILNNRFKENENRLRPLKEICYNEKLKPIISFIEYVNSQINNIYNEEISVDDLLLLYESISSNAKSFDYIIPGIGKQLENLKPSLFNRITQLYNEQKQYDKVISLIIKYPKFYESPALLKNIGNSCINYLAENNLNENNYKLYLSLFLTSAYSDQVMLYSLEETSWDDDYTFSLIDAIGSSYEFHSNLPENVNYEDITDKNISIGEAQRYLVEQFEYLLNNQKINNNLLEKIQNFYIKEKEAIEGIISIISNEIIFSTPYFAKKFNLEKEILEQLVEDYNLYGNEEALEIGELYNSTNTNKTIDEFISAKEIFKNILISIKNINNSLLTKYITKQNISKIKKYSSIYDDFESKVSEALEPIIKKDLDNKNLLDMIMQLIKVSQTKDKLKYIYANYASGLCVSRINAGKMSNYEGLQIMSDAYRLLPNDSRVCTNIIALIRMNILDILNDRTTNSYSIYSILDNINTNKSNAFKHNAGELVKARKEILAQLPPDARVAIESGINLSIQGRELKKGLDYLAKLGGVSTINDPLAALRSRLGGLDLPF